MVRRGKRAFFAYGDSKSWVTTQTDMNNILTKNASTTTSSSGKPLRCWKAAQLARGLGISHWNLRDWGQRYGTGAAAVKIASLRRELDAIRAQNDNLKKPWP